MTYNANTLIAQTGFFKGISEEGRTRLASICAAKRIAKKAILFREGDPGHSMFLLAMGSIRLSKMTDDGKEVVIRVVKLHEVFAEVVLFERDTFPVTATALSDAIVLQIPRQEIRNLLRNENFRDDFIRMLMQKQRYLAGQIQMLATCDVEQRFFHFLRDQYGERDEIRMPLPKQELAAAIGATPETLSRLIARLKRQKLLAWTGRTLRLHPSAWKISVRRH
ncbi:MAG: Crp/Fnr family transcriptional regulator [Verrucomicrobiae bacterium]|nr:Crp/Fnr family transcriptional regulator [Verrucomicrobiae bacterium]